LSSFWLILKQQWTIKISSPLFSIFSLAAILVGSRDHRTQFGRGPSKDHSTKVWFKLAQWLQRSWLKCEKLTDGRRTLSGDNKKVNGLKLFTGDRMIWRKIIIRLKHKSTAYNYHLSNQVQEMSSLCLRFMVFNPTFNNISVISWQSVLLVEKIRVPGENHWL
jgi:hypothetical protein